MNSCGSVDSRGVRESLRLWKSKRRGRMDAEGFRGTSRRRDPDAAHGMRRDDDRGARNAQKAHIGDSGGGFVRQGYGGLGGKIRPPSKTVVYQKIKILSIGKLNALDARG